MKRRAHYLGVATVIVAGVSFSWAAMAKLSKSGSSDVSFTAIGPGGLKIVGTGKEVRVADDGRSVTVAVPLRSIQTGIDLRDKHMHDKYLEDGRYPEAVLEVPRAALKVPAAGEVAADATGTVRMHGKSKDIPFHYSAKRSGAQMNVSGTLHLNMKDFGIEVPSYLGITVKPDVEVSVRFDAADG
jgi:polyisoprenoid-binding protein YceI